MPPMADWLCVAVDYGTTNPLHALLLGLGMDGTLYVVAEWRWDSRLQGRQMTDVEYSRALRDWLNTVKLPAPDLRALAAVHGRRPVRTQFQGAAVPGRMGAVDGVNTVVDGIRLGRRCCTWTG